MTREPWLLLRAALALGVGGGALFALLLLLYGGIPSLLHLAYVAGTIGCAVLHFATPWTRPRRKLAAGAVVACATSWFAATTLVTGRLADARLAFSGLAAALPFLALAPLARGRHAAPRLLTGWLAAALCGLGTSSIATFRAIYSYTSASITADVARAEAQPGVRVAFRAGTHDLYDPRSLLLVGDGRVLAAFSDSSGLGGRHGVAVLPEGGELGPPMMDGLVRDQATGRLFGIGNEGEGAANRFFWIDPGTGVRGSVALAETLGLAAHFDERRRLVYVVHELGDLSVVSADEPRLVRHVEMQLYHTDGAAPFPALDRLYVRSSDGFVGAIDLATLSVERRFLGVRAAGMAVSVSETRRELYAAEVATRVVHVLDAATLAPVRRLAIEPGLREIVALDPEPVLAAGNYFTGDLVFVDATDGRVLGRRYAGSLIRALAWDTAERVVWVASALGVVRVEVPLGG